MGKTFYGVAVVVLAMAMLTATGADYPSWWIQRDVVRQKSAVITNDFAAVNSGQLKWIATCAREELDWALPGGAGPAIAAVADSLPEASNGRLINAGQLKVVAKLFYDRLIAFGYTNGCPWTETRDDDRSFSAVNIGQVKHVFAFDLDTDADRLPDWWERRLIDADPFDPYDALDEVLPEKDPDGDGRRNDVEYAEGTDPLLPSRADTNGLIRLLVTTPLRKVRGQ